MKLEGAPVDSPLDLAACEREPIHTPGAIQPFGYLLVLHGDALEIVQASANCGELFARPVEALLGSSLTALLPRRAGIALRKLAAGERERSHVQLTLRGRGRATRRYEATVHRQGALWLLELERAAGRGARGLFAFHSDILQVNERLKAAEDARGFCRQVAAAVRTLTDYDRVMIYQFDDAMNGEVIAEARRDAVPSFLGQHFPASDIPAQARALYRENWVRVIPSAYEQPVPLVPGPNPITGAPLDLSRCLLRAVSPVHLQYLKNMGVDASMSISLVVDGQLWGLIACHHETPKLLTVPCRLECEVIGLLLSGEIALRGREQASRYLALLHAVCSRIVATMNREGMLAQTLAHELADLASLFGAGGCATCFEGTCARTGATPDEDEIASLVRWVDDHMTDGVFHTEALSEHYAPARRYKDVASGLLAIRLGPGKSERFVLWFRPEEPRTIAWAGNPRHPAEVDPRDHRLGPRRSFRVWREVLAGRSRTWAPAEIQAAGELRNALVEIALAQSRQELRRLKEVDRLKNMLLSVVSHELRTPLTSIKGYAEFLEERIGGPLSPEQTTFVRQIQENARRLERQVDDLLDYARVEAGMFKLDRATADLAGIVASAVDTVRPCFLEKQVALVASVPKAPVVLTLDRRRIEQVLINLLANALKFTPAGGRVRVTLRRVAGQARVAVADTGIGIAPAQQAHVFDTFYQAESGLRRGYGGLGLGLAIARSIVLAHGGTIGVESEPGKGSTFWFVLPLAGPRGTSH